MFSFTFLLEKLAGLSNGVYVLIREIKKYIYLQNYPYWKSIVTFEQ